MTNEEKQLVEDAAKLLGLKTGHWVGNMLSYYRQCDGLLCEYFNPFDPERGDLMKVANAADLTIDFEYKVVMTPNDGGFYFDKNNYYYLAIAVLHAASAVLKSRGGE